MNRTYILLIGIFMALFFVACNQKPKHDDTVVLTYKGKQLTQEDVNLHFANISSITDSLEELERYKKSWLSKQIIITEANNKLPAKAVNVQEQMLQYEADLLYFKYINYYIENKLNKQVSIAEIDTFYNAHSDVLISTEPLIKSVYIEVPKKLKGAYKVKYWIKSSKKKHQDKLNAFCYKNAKVYDDFEGQWMPYSRLSKLTNIASKKKIKKGQLIETHNDSLKQFLYISNIVKKGETIPREYADKMVTEMIINLRKKKLQNELEIEIEDKVNTIINH